VQDFKVNLSGGTTLELGMALSPLRNIKERIDYHKHFDSDTCDSMTDCFRDQSILIFVGFNQNLKALKVDTARTIVNEDLKWLHLKLFLINIIVFLLLSIGIDRILYARITKPLTQL
jgi:hypothetical protein